MTSSLVIYIFLWSRLICQIFPCERPGQPFAYHILGEAKKKIENEKKIAKQRVDNAHRHAAYTPYAKKARQQEKKLWERRNERTYGANSQQTFEHT
ncbi:CFC_HP_G0001410.mRNA.1.CDS.1 [Saccharomyces cerevisiae]|nr:CFC_HP_G0001410.mRNA.1.CDS.1 [Saccharomyces cerevisiae]CAI6934308.1 CFC_HP_G0001410.mRNA.1.CDS.1 [Saccharomyces cerevisiae]